LASSIQGQGVGVLPGTVNPGPAFDVAEVTSRMVKGDEMAYRLFYDEYYDRLRRYLLVITAGNEDAARDALQSALLRVVKHIRQFSNENEFWCWLAVLAKTAFFDQTRKRKRYWSFLERFTHHTEIEHSIHTRADSDGQLLMLLEQSLTTLLPDEKELIESKYLEGASVRQIAQDFQTTEKAVESRLVRIRRKLKALLLEGLKHESLPK
jgi:RNA polymerase sigma-70 factor (ECF subfamily)